MSNIKTLLKNTPEYIIAYFQYYALYSIKNNTGNIELSQQIYLTPFPGTITLTFGDVAESHAGMQHIGVMAETGFELSDIQQAKTYFESKGCETLTIRLNDFYLGMRISQIPRKKNIYNKLEQTQNSKRISLSPGMA